MIPPLWLANIFGWIVSHKRLLLYILAGVVVFIVLVFAYKGCTKKEIKLDPKEIVEAQQAIADNDQAKQVEVLAKSEAREAVADETAVNANAVTINTLKESREKWAAATDEERRAELERRAKQ